MAPVPGPGSSHSSRPRATSPSRTSPSSSTCPSPSFTAAPVEGTRTHCPRTDSGATSGSGRTMSMPGSKSTGGNRHHPIPSLSLQRPRAAGSDRPARLRGHRVGKRQRRRERTAESAPNKARLPPDQQMARVNVPVDQWRDFRVLAVKQERSVAEYLGKLVLKELRRAHRRLALRSPADNDHTVTPASEPRHTSSG